jgi:hypothetical protein
MYRTEKTDLHPVPLDYDAGERVRVEPYGSSAIGHSFGRQHNQALGTRPHRIQFPCAIDKVRHFGCLRIGTSNAFDQELDKSLATFNNRVDPLLDQIRTLTPDHDIKDRNRKTPDQARGNDTEEYKNDQHLPSNRVPGPFYFVKDLHCLAGGETLG